MWKRQSSGIHRTIIGLPCNTQLHMLFLVQLSTQLLTSCVLWIGRTQEPKTHRACSKKSLVDFAQCFSHIYRTRYMPDERRFVKALAISKPNRVQKMTLSLSRVQKKTQIADQSVPQTNMGQRCMPHLSKGQAVNRHISKTRSNQACSKFRSVLSNR